VTCHSLLLPVGGVLGALCYFSPAGKGSASADGTSDLAKLSFHLKNEC
jgi:hypothetical protein